MFKLTITLLLCGSVLFSMSAKPKIYQDYHILAANTDKEKVTPLNIKDALIKNGFEVSSFKEIISPEYTSYHIINFLDKSLSLKILQDLPQAGLFYPMGMAVYQKKNDPYLWIAFLSSRANSKVLNLKGGINFFGAYDRKTIAAILTTIKQARFLRHNSSQKRQIQNLDIHTSPSTTTGKELISSLARILSRDGFIIDSIKDIFVSADYDYYKSISFHQKGLLETIIKSNPEAGAFFPSTILVYKRKGSSTANILNIDATNIIDSSNIQDTATLRTLLKRQAAINKALQIK